LQEGISQSKFRNWLKESGSVERVAGSFVPLRLMEIDGRLFPLVVVGWIMFSLSSFQHYFLYTQPTDMRKSFDGFCGLVAQRCP